MMYNIIPLVIITVSLGVIVYIVLKKFPALSAVDLQTLPQERARDIKERIIQDRLEVKLIKTKEILAKIFIPLVLGAKNIFSVIYQQILEWEKRYQKKRLVTAQHVTIGQNKVKELLALAKQESQVKNFIGAEKNYIAIIKLDHKSIEAYRGLGELYLAQEDYKQAKETYEYLLQLQVNNSEVFKSLALIAQKTGDLGVAEQYYLKAITLDKNNVNLYLALADIYKQTQENVLALQSLLEAQKLEPNNSKIIDKLIEISIILKDQAAAKQYLEKIKRINPENQKIADWEEMVKEK